VTLASRPSQADNESILKGVDGGGMTVRTGKRNLSRWTACLQTGLRLQRDRRHGEGTPALWFLYRVGLRHFGDRRRPLAELNCNAQEGGEELLPQLEKVTAHLGITLTYKAIQGRAEGLSKGGAIEVEESLPTPARCGVLVHELSDVMLGRRLCCVRCAVRSLQGFRFLDTT
jgi:hypothetical protein